MNTLTIHTLTMYLICASISFLITFQAKADEPAATDYGHVVVYRLAGLPANKGVYYRIYVDGQRIAKLKRNTALQLTLPVGRYEIAANDPGEQRVVVDVTAGQTRYLQGSIDRDWALSLHAGAMEPGQLLSLNSRYFDWREHAAQQLSMR